MKTKDYAVWVGLLVVLLVGANFPIGGKTTTERVIEKYGVASGGVFDMPVVLHNDITVGGGWYATTSTSGTYLGSTIVNSKFITETGETAVTRTMQTNAALSSAGFLPNVGDTATRYIFASTSIVTLAGNTGVLLHGMGTTTLAIMASSTARLDFVRLNSTNNNAIEVLITQD